MYTEAILLHIASAKVVAQELFMLFSRVDIAGEILTDQGSCFMCRILKAMCRWSKREHMEQAQVA